MNLSEAIRILIERAEINRAMCPVAQSDFDKFCRDEADAIDLVLKELKNNDN